MSYNFEISKVEGNKVFFYIVGDEIENCNITLYHKKTGLILHRELGFKLVPNINYYFGIHDNIIDFVGESVLEFDVNNSQSKKQIDFGFGKDIDFNIELNSINGTSFYTYWEIFLDKVYETDKIKIEENDVVIDIGSNIGLFALYANNFNPKIIYCLEPDTNNYLSLLKNTIKQNKIEVLNFAVTENCGQTLFNTDPNGICSTTDNYKGLFNYVNYDNQIKVNTIDINTLLDMISEKTVDFLKLDCEGCEEILFQTIKKENIEKIKKIVLEYHSEEIKNNIISKLKSINFIIDKTFEIMTNKNCGMIYAYNQKFIQ
jgi:FkbM family methyltransferase